jgi:hypothetical protein
MHSTQSITMSGYRDQPVPHTFFELDTPTDHLALVLPGRGYTAQMPLLFYPVNLMLDKGADVLRLEYAYDRRPDFEALSTNEQLRWLFADVTAAYRAGMNRRPYQQVTLIGKSLGTLAMGHILTTETLPHQTNAIWLTPVIHFDLLCQQIKQFKGRSLFVIGTSDFAYNPAVLAELCQATGGQVVAVAGADHGFNIKDDVAQSIQAVEQAVRAIAAFLNE